MNEKEAKTILKSKRRRAILKVSAVAYIAGLITVITSGAAGSITVLAKLCGAGYTWASACGAIFIALGALPVVLISKVVIDFCNATGGQK